MSFTIEQYTALKEAIATGATTITYGDKTVSYRSLAEMKDLVRMIEEELFPERRLRRRRLACIDRGYFSKRGEFHLKYRVAVKNGPMRRPTKAVAARRSGWQSPRVSIAKYRPRWLRCGIVPVIWSVTTDGRGGLSKRSPSTRSAMASSRRLTPIWQLANS